MNIQSGNRLTIRCGSAMDSGTVFVRAKAPSQGSARSERRRTVELPEWYVQTAVEEEEFDTLIIEQSKPRHYCPTCGLLHRAACPSGPGVADILSAPTPEPKHRCGALVSHSSEITCSWCVVDPPCEDDNES